MVLGMRMPKTPERPYHRDTGLLRQKGKRDLNGDQPCTVLVVVAVFLYQLNLKMCTPQTVALQLVIYLK